MVIDNISQTLSVELKLYGNQSILMVHMNRVYYQGIVFEQTLTLDAVGQNLQTGGPWHTAR